MNIKEALPGKNSSCSFQEHGVRSALLKKREMGRFINELIFHYTGKDNLVDYIFVNDDFLLQMNRKYLDHDTYTDIITFDLSDEITGCITAEIYISIDRVSENAKMEKVRKSKELLRVIIHGALHLSGFNDSTPDEKNEMRELETRWMDQYLTPSKGKHN